MVQDHLDEVGKLQNLAKRPGFDPVRLEKKRGSECGFSENDVIETINT
jgi:hypothetical protein